MCIPDHMVRSHLSRTFPWYTIPRLALAFLMDAIVLHLIRNLPWYTTSFIMFACAWWIAPVSDFVFWDWKFTRESNITTIAIMIATDLVLGVLGLLPILLGSSIVSSFAFFIGLVGGCVIRNFIKTTSFYTLLKTRVGGARKKQQ